MKKINVAVLGATGLVGQAFIKMLINHPWFEIKMLIGSERSCNRLFSEATSWLLKESPSPEILQMPVETLSVAELKEKNIRVIFSAIPSALARNIEDELRRQGFFIFSNASAFRYEPEIPILIPEVNKEQADLIELQLKKYQGFILPTSNCSTSGLVIILKALERFKLKKVFVSTMQAISGAGRRAIAALEINNNIIPYIKDEEIKIQRETRKILSALKENQIIENQLPVEATCTRVNTVFGHLESVFIETETEPEIDAVEAAISEFNNSHRLKELISAPQKIIHFFNVPDRPQPLLDSWLENGMAVAAGHLKATGSGLSLILLVNNLIRGAAGNCVLNAELLHAKHYLSNWR